MPFLNKSAVHKSRTGCTVDCCMHSSVTPITLTRSLSLCFKQNHLVWGSIYIQWLKLRILIQLVQMYSVLVQRLKVGGKLLYCSNSLARQENDDVIPDCCPSMLRSLRVLQREDLEEDPLTRELLITAKKFGLEDTKYGWRLLPDLAFQHSQYFSLLKRISWNCFQLLDVNLSFVSNLRCISL